ncbi:unnamed protein product, partial [Mesorhabditis belari]|uniref:Uncharacterized protein n=1 Tax=Mesorhabditis belari TaxID=2138241 RepID=A0AAF3J9K3_9BILA
MFYQGSVSVIISGESNEPVHYSPSPVPFLLNLFLKYTPFHVTPIKRAKLLEKVFRLSYFVVGIGVLLVPIGLYFMNDYKIWSLDWFLNLNFVCWSFIGFLAGLQLTRWSLAGLETSIHSTTRKFSVVKKDLRKDTSCLNFRLKFFIFPLMVLSMSVSFAKTPILEAKMNGFSKPRLSSSRRLQFGQKNKNQSV